MANSRPVSDVVDVDISTTPAFKTRPAFDVGLFLSKDEADEIFVPAERVRTYASMSEVAEDFDASSRVYDAAQAYFSANPAPDRYSVGAHYTTAIPANFVGEAVSVATVSSYTGITDGALKVNIDGTEMDVTGINFSALTNIDDILSAVVTAIKAAHLDYADASIKGRLGKILYLVSGTTGASALIGAPSAPATGTDIRSLLGWGNGIIAPGADADSNVQAALDAVQDFDDGWYSLIPDKSYRDTSDIELMAEWIEARVKTMAHVSNASGTASDLVTNDIASTLKTRGFNRSMSLFHYDGSRTKPGGGSVVEDEYPDATAIGRILGLTDFTAENGSITANFKSLPSNSVVPITSSNRAALQDKNCNYYTDVGGIPILQDGRMASGQWFDVIHGLDWLKTEIEFNIFETLASSKKIALTDSGVTVLVNQMRRALEKGVRNGLISRQGTWPVTGEYFENGYKIIVGKVGDLTQADRQARKAPTLQFQAIGAGAIHGVNVNGEFQV